MSSTANVSSMWNSTSKEYTEIKDNNKQKIFKDSIAFVRFAWKKLAIESTGITVPIEEILKYLTLKQVSIPNPEEIRYYLRQYPDIINLVEFACDETRNYFAPPTQLSLELYRDPEIDDQYLTLYVRQSEYEENIMDKIDAIQSTYINEIADKTGYFLLTTDFQFPK